MPPQYLSNERDDLEFNPGAFVTSYRILVSVVVAFLGSLKIAIWKEAFAYSDSDPFTDTTSLEWCYVGLISSSCVNFNLAQVNQILNYENLPLGSTSLVCMKTTQ